MLVWAKRCLIQNPDGKTFDHTQHAVDSLKIAARAKGINTAAAVAAISCSWIMPWFLPVSQSLPSVTPTSIASQLDFGWNCWQVVWRAKRCSVDPKNDRQCPTTSSGIIRSRLLWSWLSCVTTTISGNGTGIALWSPRSFFQGRSSSCRENTSVGVLLPEILPCPSLDRFFAEFDEALVRGGFIAMGGIDSRNRTSNVLK